jgi:hypothetical protein
MRAITCAPQAPTVIEENEGYTVYASGYAPTDISCKEMLRQQAPVIALSLSFPVSATPQAGVGTTATALSMQRATTWQSAWSRGPTKPSLRGPNQGKGAAAAEPARYAVPIATAGAMGCGVAACGFAVFMSTRCS